MDTISESKNKPVIADNMSINLYGWMINHLDLNTKALLLFMAIYSFSKGPEACYYGTIEYSGEIMKGATKQTVITALKDMITKGYITKSIKPINGKNRICYTPTDRVKKLDPQGQIIRPAEVKKLDPQGQIIRPAEVKKLDPQGQIIRPNNKRDNKDNSKVIYSTAAQKTSGSAREPSYDIEEFERQFAQPLKYVSQKERAAQANEQPQ